MLWCQPNNKFEKIAKLGKAIEHGNVMFYERRVKENLKGGRLGPPVGVQGWGWGGCLLIRSGDAVGGVGWGGAGEGKKPKAECPNCEGKEIGNLAKSWHRQGQI